VRVENHAGYVASLHIRITVVCLHTLMLSTKRRARAVLNVMCKRHCITFADSFTPHCGPAA
jgi:hypothetical protein